MKQNTSRHDQTMPCCLADDHWIAGSRNLQVIVPDNPLSTQVREITECVKAMLRNKKPLFTAVIGPQPGLFRLDTDVLGRQLLRCLCHDLSDLCDSVPVADHNLYFRIFQDAVLFDAPGLADDLPSWIRQQAADYLGGMSFGQEIHLFIHALDDIANRIRQLAGSKTFRDWLEGLSRLERKNRQRLRAANTTWT